MEDSDIHRLYALPTLMNILTDGSLMSYSNAERENVQQLYVHDFIFIRNSTPEIPKENKK